MMDLIRTTTILSNLAVVFGACYAVISWRRETELKRKHEITEEFLFVTFRLKAIETSFLSALKDSQFELKNRLRICRDKLNEKEQLLQRAKELCTLISIFLNPPKFDARLNCYNKDLGEYALFTVEVLGKVISGKTIAREDVVRNQDLTNQLNASCEALRELIMPYCAKKSFLVRRNFLLIVLVLTMCAFFYCWGRGWL